MSTSDLHDPSGRPIGAVPSSDGLIGIEVLSGVVPLDDQFGATDVLTVPETLQSWMFGSEESDADTADPQSRATYAILDGARIKNLAEKLAATDLAYRCLFKGAAFDELGAVAPWIVEVKDGDSFTRNLFTVGDAGWQLWDDAPGIFVRTHGSLDSVWAHFRKFTKVRDEADAWLYWRFWEAGGLVRLMTSWRGDRDKLAHFAFVSGTGEPLIFLCPEAKAGTVTRCAPNPDLRGVTPNSRFVITDADRAVLSAWRAEGFDGQLLADLKTSFPALDKAEAGEVTHWLNSVIGAAQRAGIRLEVAIGNFAHAAYLLGADPSEHGETRHILRDATLHEKDRARLARQAAEKYSTVRH